MLCFSNDDSSKEITVSVKIHDEGNCKELPEDLKFKSLCKALVSEPVLKFILHVLLSEILKNDRFCHF